MNRLAGFVFIGSLIATQYSIAAQESSGVLYISGGLREGVCKLEMDSEWQQVVIGSISSAVLSKPGDRAEPVDFHIRFRDCARGKGSQRYDDLGTLSWSEYQPVISLTFLAPADVDTPDLFAVRGTSGIGLRITDNDSYSLKPGRRSQPVFLTPGSDEMTFKVAVERTAAPLIEGLYTATVDFRVSYD